MDAEPGTGQQLLTSAGFRDAFIVRLTPFGSYAGAWSYGGTQNDYANDVAFDAAFAWYLAGTFSGTLLNGFSGTPMLQSVGSEDAFLICTSNTGYVYWTKQFGGNGADQAMAVMPTNFGRVNFCGLFRDSDLTEGANLANQGGTDIFLTALDPDGNVVEAYAIGSATSEYVLDIAAHPTGPLVITGAFDSTIDVDLGFGNELITATNDMDAFTVKYSSASVGIVPADSTSADLIIGNPCNASFQFVTKRRIVSAVAIDALGREVALSIIPQQDRVEVPTNHLPSGAYVFQFRDTEEISTAGRFVVVR
ncbi:MAG: hypothetical protein IPI55_15580 [Flavobacteriales bacterium]|nr:hypothetical protein [Flavobacteriales bacterium]